jgi:hypothetical protein
MGSFWSHKAWSDVGSFNEELSYAMDHEYWGRLAYSGYRPICLQQTLAAFRLHPQGKTYEGLRNFYYEEYDVARSWIDKVKPAEAKIIKKYLKTLGLRFFLIRLRHFKHRLVERLGYFVRYIVETVICLCL